MENNLLVWPPPFVIKHHPRARRVKLKASLQDGIEIIVPLRFNQKYIPQILEENKTWIQKRWQEIQNIPRNTHELPEEIIFHSIQQTWRVIYLKSDAKKLRLIVRPQQEIVLLGDINNKKLAFKLLTSWVKSQAKIHLVNQLNLLSEQAQLKFNKATIRSQKSRWGSCTVDKNISLNYKLLFIPPELMTYIMIHELCHTVHLNHSSQFWRLVASYTPDWKQHARAIRKSEKWIPRWV